MTARPDMSHFRYDGLPADFQPLGKFFFETAWAIAALPANHEGAQIERAVALRKLLEARDAALRVR